jgi:hypothetical protein
MAFAAEAQRPQRDINTLVNAVASPASESSCLINASARLGALCVSAATVSI